MSRLHLQVISPGYCSCSSLLKLMWRTSARPPSKCPVLPSNQQGNSTLSPSSSTTQIWPVPGEKIPSYVSLVWDKQHTQENEGKKYFHRHKHISWVRSDYCNTQDKSQTRHVKRICKPKKGPFLAALSREHVRHRAHRLSVVCSDYPSPQVFLKPVRMKLATRKHLAFTIHLQKPLHKGLLSLHLGTPACPSFLGYN